MASTDQGITTLFLAQPLAGGIDGLSLSNYGIYTYFTSNTIETDRGVTIDTISRVVGPGGGGGGSSVTIYYKMRGYYVSGSVYEVYVVTGTPSSTPPSGHTLIDVVVVSTWQV